MSEAKTRTETDDSQSVCRNVLDSFDCNMFTQNTALLIIHVFIILCMFGLKGFGSSRSQEEAEHVNKQDH